MTPPPARPPSPSSRTGWSRGTAGARVLAAIAGLVLFGVFVRRAGMADVLDGVASVGWGFVAILALSGFRFAVRARAWTLCAEPAERLKFRDVFEATLAGNALGNMTLGLLVSEPAKVVLLAKPQTATGALAALAVENLFYTLSVALVLAGGLLALIVRLGTGAISWVASVGLVGGLALGVVAVHAVLWRRVSLAGQWHARLGRGWRGGWFDVLLSWLGRLEARMHAAYPRTRAGLAPIAALEGLFHVAAFAETYVILSLVTGSPPTWLDAFLFESMNRLIMAAFSFVPLRIGVDEAGTGLFADLLQFGTTTGVTVAIVRKTRMLWWVGVGVPILMRRGVSLGEIATGRFASTRTSPPAPPESVVAIMARSPATGHAAIKTRLASAVPETRDRIDLYAAFIADQVRTCHGLTEVALRVAFTPEGGAAGFTELGIQEAELMPQRGDDLASRERALFEDLFAAGFRRAVIVGSDLPTLPARILEEAVARLDTAGPAIVGPSEDGGYYLLGLTAPGEPAGVPDLFTGIRWSTRHALADTLAAAARLGIAVSKVEGWYDVDDTAGLERLRAELRDPARAAAAPATASVLKRID